MLNCHEVTRLVSASQERPLALRERLSLKVHLMMCDGCRNFQEQIPFLRNTMRAYAQGKNEELEK
jgi:hypothetical protein